VPVRPCGDIVGLLLCTGLSQAARLKRSTWQPQQHVTAESRLSSSDLRGRTQRATIMHDLSWWYGGRVVACTHAWLRCGGQRKPPRSLKLPSLLPQSESYDPTLSIVVSPRWSWRAQGCDRPCRDPLQLSWAHRPHCKAEDRKPIHCDARCRYRPCCAVILRRCGIDGCSASWRRHSLCC
jgi:hypothetical protein